MWNLLPFSKFLFCFPKMSNNLDLFPCPYFYIAITNPSLNYQPCLQTNIIGWGDGLWFSWDTLQGRAALQICFRAVILTFPGAQIHPRDSAPSVYFLDPPPHLAGGARLPPIAPWERAWSRWLSVTLQVWISFFCPCPWSISWLWLTHDAGSRFPMTSEGTAPFQLWSCILSPGPELDISALTLGASRVVLFLLEFCKFVIMFPMLGLLKLIVLGTMGPQKV